MGKSQIQISGSAITLLHGTLAAAAFLLAFLVGVTFHYEKLVSNAHWDYPNEWFPSVSATIGDYVFERNLFQLLIAVVSGPRFILHSIVYLTTRSKDSNVAEILLGISILRTFSAGGWIFVTSSDSGLFHDVLMILYIVFTIPYHLGYILISPSSKIKFIAAGTFWSCSVPMIYYYIQHKVELAPDAYSMYSIFEWILVFSDIFYDFSWDFSRYSINFEDRGEEKQQSLFSIIPSQNKASSAFIYRFESLYSTGYTSTAETRDFFSDCIISMTFWSHMVGFPILVFYSAVWNMGLSNFEVLLFNIAIAPLFFAMVKSYFLSSRILERCCQFFLIAGLFIYANEKDDEGQTRLILIAISIFFGMIGILGGVYRDLNLPKMEREGKIVTFLIGLLFTLLLKLANYSLNPFWPIMNEWNGGYNLTGGIIGIIAFMNLILSKKSIPVKQLATIKKSSKSYITSSLAFGTVSFLVHLLLTDSGTIISYGATGISSTSSAPTTSMPYGALTIFFISIGLYLGQTLSPSILVSNQFFSMFAVGFSVFLSAKRWIGFSGGLIVVCYIGAIYEVLFESVMKSGSVSLAFLLHDLLLLASTFATAYAFVPGGNFFRERENTILVLCVGLLYLGIYNLQSSSSFTPTTSHIKNRRMNQIKRMLILVPIIALMIVTYRIHTLPLIDGGYHSTESGLFSTAIWTIHFGVDGSARESQRRIAHLLDVLQADVVGLLETDNQRIVGGNRDLQFLTRNYPFYDFGPSPKDSTWGCVLLSRFKIIESSHHLLPSPAGELAPAIMASILVHGELVDVVVAHNGQEEDPLDRQLQSQELGRLLSLNYPRPAVFLGYIISKPHAEKPEPYKYFIEDGRMLDIDDSDLERWCQYIFYRGLERKAYARVTRGDPAVSDTEVQMAKFKTSSKFTISLNPNSTDLEPPTLLETSVHSPASLRPESHSLPKKLYVDGVFGHKYHVLENVIDRNRFDSEFGPRYYLEPEQKIKLEEEEAAAALAVPECPVS